MTGGDARKRLAIVRMAVGLYAAGSLVFGLGELARVAAYPASSFEPVGVVRLLSSPLPVWLVVAISIASVVLAAATIVGAAYRIVAPLAAAGVLWTLSYRSSWGMVFHTDNLVALHLIALPLFARPGASDDANARWGLRIVMAITCVTYVLAGVAKLRIAGLSWLSGDLLRDQIAFDNARKVLLGEGPAPLATVLLDRPAILVGLSLMTLVVELGAPIAMVGGTIARAWAVSAWCFHAGVVLTMNVWFPYPLLGVAFLPILPVERLRLPTQLRV